MRPWNTSSKSPSPPKGRLLEHLGPEKTLQLWHLFLPPQEGYLKTRRKLFAGMDGATMDWEIRQLNRE